MSNISKNLFKRFILIFRFKLFFGFDFFKESLLEVLLEVGFFNDCSDFLRIVDNIKGKYM